MKRYSNNKPDVLSQEAEVYDTNVGLVNNQSAEPPIAKLTILDSR